jgi:hypothetical protein
MAAGIARHETGGSDPGVPAKHPGTHVTLRIGGPMVFNTVERNGRTELVRDRDPGTPIEISETKDGGLKAETDSGNSVSMDLELPMPGPNAANPDLTPDPSEPAIQYALPADEEFVNSTRFDGERAYFRDFSEAGDHPLTIQEDGHGGLVALNEQGNPVQVDIHLPAPGPHEGHPDPHHPGH